MIKEADLWQTGGDLISTKSGIILHPLGDRTQRAVASLPGDADRGRDLPLGKKTAADPKRECTDNIGTAAMREGAV